MQAAYRRTVADTEVLDTDSPLEKRMRQMFRLNTDWFMQTLLMRKDAMSMHSALEVRVPFCDWRLVEYAYNMPWALKSPEGREKGVLRKAFEGDWLPPEILWREKAAFSDAVGHSMVDDIKEYAESLYTDEEFQLRRANYSAHCMPFTKESLFYREIFEKYYHDQSRTIVGFWMPNKAWPNCNVNDPSARVLANYGASGV